MEPIYEAFYRVLQSWGYSHPVHPTLIYLPIGSVMAAFIFALIARGSGRHQLAVTARHCIALALVSVFPAMLMGYIDWRHFHGAHWMLPFRMKMLLAGLLTVLLFTALFLHRKKEPASKLILMVYTLCFLTVVGLGYYGGEIVFGSRHRYADRTAEEAEKFGASTDAFSFAAVLQIFEQHCVQCHKGRNPPLALRLGSYGQVMAGSEKGPVVIPGESENSPLVARIKGEKEPSMPFGQPLLSNSLIQTIVRWVENGALPEAAGAGVD